ncbi:MAG: barstar family protein [Bacteroidota bacterium]
MGTFKDTKEVYARVDFQIIRNGWCQCYWKRGILEQDLDWLVDQGYELASFDCHGLAHLMKQIKERFYFPDFFRPNFNALSDCLIDLEWRAIGLVVVFRSLDRLKREDAHTLMDVFVDLARNKFLFGKRLLVLAQVDDPDFHLERLGGCDLPWNGREWLDANRF